MNATKQIRTVQGLLTLLAMAAVLTTFPANAQETADVRAQASTDQPTRSYAVLHVNVATGSDRQGAGSAEQPYKTITHALQQTTSASTVILLAPGHYSHETGEQFPLRLRPGVTIQGNAGATRDTLIVGGGEFQERSTAQPATIVTSDRSGLANVLVSTPGGSGVWITAGAPILRRVALVANAAAGIQVTEGAPVIENSYFNRNQRGLVIQGNGRATVRGNLFEATGHAITVTSPAVPTINNNRIAGNEVGIALKNNARPALAANVLDDNGRNGVVEVESVDVAASPAADPTVVTAPVAIEPDSTAATEGAVTERTVSISTSASERLATLSAPAAAPAAAPVVQQRPTAPVAPAPGALAGDDAAAVDGDAISIAVIPADGQVPESTPDPGDEKSEGISKLLARLNQHPSTVPSRVESAAGTDDGPERVENVESLEGTGQRLPVPSAAIPGGDNAAGLSPPGTVSLARSFRYRVLVDMTDADDLRVLVPDAFRTQVGNGVFMQAGAYVDENEAQERLDWLQANGIGGRVNVRE